MHLACVPLQSSSATTPLIVSSYKHCSRVMYTRTYLYGSCLCCLGRKWCMAAAMVDMAAVMHHLTLASGMLKRNC